MALQFLVAYTLENDIVDLTGFRFIGAPTNPSRIPAINENLSRNHVNYGFSSRFPVNCGRNFRQHIDPIHFYE